MKLLFPLLLSCLTFDISAQTLTYFDDEDFLTDSTTSYYYVVSKSNDDRSTLAFYTENSKPRYVEWPGNSQVVTHRTFYYSNGTQMATSAFSLGLPFGRVSIAYPDGAPMAEIEFPNWDDHTSPVKVLQYRDASGVVKINKGNGTAKLNTPLFRSFIGECEGEVVNGLKQGIWKGKTGKEVVYEESYNNGFLIAGKSIKDGVSYDYTKLETMPEPKNGMSSLYKFIAGKLKYPSKARSARIEGRVFVGFVVNEDGTVSDVKPAQGLSPELDAEAVRVISLSPEWTPAVRRGVPVKQRMIIPIQFKRG